MIWGAERVGAVAGRDDGRRARRFSVELDGIGAFPNFRRARVVWVGVEQEVRLELLPHDFEVALEAIG